jgi:hypothetical protein
MRLRSTLEKFVRVLHIIKEVYARPSRIPDTLYFRAVVSERLVNKFTTR